MAGDRYKGAAVSSGCGIGRAVIIKESAPDVSGARFSGADNERRRLDEAAQKYITSTKKLIASLKNDGLFDNAAILEGHLAMLADPFMLRRMKELIGEDSKTAEQAAEEVCSSFSRMFDASGDELTRRRSADVNEIKSSLINYLCGNGEQELIVPEDGCVLVAAEFTPAMTSRLDAKRVRALVGERGGATSHSAIIARSLGIPCVLGIENAASIFKDGETLIVDADRGEVLVSSGGAEAKHYEELAKKHTQSRLLDEKYARLPTVTKGGCVKKVFANIALPADAASAADAGAEGVGLFRTEFLYMDRESPPGEEEQLEAYLSVASAMGGREVIIRTLDAGGDKHIPYLGIPAEENPFMGLRAIRYCLKNTQLFKTQLRAVLRAAAQGNIKLMLPLVCTQGEVIAAKKLVLQCERELEAEGVPFKKGVPLGVMIETPAAVLISDILAGEVDFFSIGTNDLTGYIMAADRGSGDVADLYDVQNPAVLRAIKTVIKNAKAAGIEVGMCGEAASLPELVPRLVEWGLDEFSVSPAAVAKTRRAVCGCP